MKLLTKTVFQSLLWTSVALAHPLAGAADTPAPNLVLILADDLGQISSNGRLRGQKTELYEGGHRVPAIFL